MTGKKLPINKLIYKHDPAIHNVNAANQVIPYLLNLSKINSILDVGCGTGTWLNVASSLGVNQITGIDGVNINENELKIPITNFLNKDLTLPIDLKQKFDLVICLEVAEHLPQHAAQTLINTLTNHGDLILFSAAIPNQGGQNHINEQWPDYWQALFEARGYFPSTDIKNFFWDNEAVEWWYRQNMLLFATKEALNNLGIPLAKNIPHIIHPALYNEKLAEINTLASFIDNCVWKPTIKIGFRTFLSSIFK